MHVVAGHELDEQDAFSVRRRVRAGEVEWVIDVGMDGVLIWGGDSVYDAAVFNAEQNVPFGPDESLMWGDFFFDLERKGWQFLSRKASEINTFSDRKQSEYTAREFHIIQMKQKYG